VCVDVFDIVFIDMVFIDFVVVLFGVDLIIGEVIMVD